MANNYFQFKQFTVNQEKCSMKVCTDACVFGGWVAAWIADLANCLDIGTGTGLLTLMLAQKTNLDIDAVEIEKDAFDQAKENFTNSPWSERLKVFHSDIKKFTPSKKYALIISNPPFFENDLKSEVKNKNIAKHDDELNLQELVEVVEKNLDASGFFAVLLPYHRVSFFERLANENEFYLQQRLLIKQTPSHNFFRGILLFGKQKITPATKELAIKKIDGSYTDEFRELLKDYYLHL